MKAIVLILCLFAISLSAQANRLEVDIDKYSCFGDMVWMRVDVTIDGELYRFNPACDFNLNKTMETPDGITCTLKSEMCFHYETSDQVEVECDFGEKVVKKFPCDNWVKGQ